MTKKELYEKVLDWFAANAESAETELRYQNNYQLLVAVILSAQCTDKRVNMISPRVFEVFPTPEVMAASSPDEVFEYIKSCSYPNNKAKNLVGMAKKLVSDFDGKVPSTIDDLKRTTGSSCMAGIFAWHEGLNARSAGLDHGASIIRKTFNRTKKNKGELILYCDKALLYNSLIFQPILLQVFLSSYAAQDTRSAKFQRC